jgi:hypothetical protein
LAFDASVLNSLTELRHLDFGEKVLTAFPMQQLLQATQLQTLRLSVNQSGLDLPRKSAGDLKAMGRDIQWVEQGNRNAKVVLFDTDGKPSQALCTKDLDPCLAVMIFQPGLCLLMHVDHPGHGGVGATSVAEMLRRHVKTNEVQTEIALVGCNSQGSVGNLRSVLQVVNELQLENAVVMASLGNRHSSCSMDLMTKHNFVGFG